MQLIRFFIVGSLFVSLFVGVDCALAGSNVGSQPSLTLHIVSSQTLNGTAGDYVSVEAQIENVSPRPISNVTTYLSLADEETKLPVDLEDWSADKGLFVGAIDAGQVLPLTWKIHFVKPGKYSLIIVAETDGVDDPQVSRITHFVVAPKRNLNPGQVLPVALGTPVILLVIMLLSTFKRNSKLT